MLVIGCDYHPSWQQICWMDTLTGETGAPGGRPRVQLPQFVPQDTTVLHLGAHAFMVLAGFGD